MNDLPLENLKKNPGHSILLALMTIDILANPLNIYPQPHGNSSKIINVGWQFSTPITAYELHSHPL